MGATPPPVLPTIQTGDQNLQLLQANVSSALSKVQATAQSGPLTGGKILASNAILTAQDNLIPHGLGKAPSLVLIFAPSANAVVWLSSSDQTNIDLMCSANCTVTVWVSA